jgi:hypothetical protein
MTAYRARWRDNATGYVARFAGLWADPYSWASRADLEVVVRDMPNGDQIEIVEVAA